MAYNVLAIRTDGDGRLYPIVSDGPEAIEFEQWDGSDLRRLVATNVAVREVVAGGLRDLAKFSDVKADVIITDSRIAEPCAKYEKGGGWIRFGGAGLAVAVAANSVSKVRAARKRRGKTLVGHVRYPWLRPVGFTTRVGFKGSDVVRIQSIDGAGDPQRDLLLDLTLPRNSDPQEIARDIARRSALYRLRFTTVTDEAREAFEALSRAEQIPPLAKQFAFYRMPTAFKVGTTTPYPSPNPSE